MDFQNEYVLVRDGNDFVARDSNMKPLLRKALKLSRTHKRGCMPSYVELWYYYSSENRVLVNFWN